MRTTTIAVVAFLCGVGAAALGAWLLQGPLAAARAGAAGVRLRGDRVVLQGDAVLLQGGREQGRLRKGTVLLRASSREKFEDLTLRLAAEVTVAPPLAPTAAEEDQLFVRAEPAR